jgi:hypothetical protein
MACARQSNRIKLESLLGLPFGQGFAAANVKYSTGRTLAHTGQLHLLMQLPGVPVKATYWYEIEFFGKSKASFYGRFLNWEKGIHDIDTIGKVFQFDSPTSPAEMKWCTKFDSRNAVLFPVERATLIMMALRLKKVELQVVLRSNHLMFPNLPISGNLKLVGSVQEKQTNLTFYPTILYFFSFQ